MLTVELKTENNPISVLHQNIGEYYALIMAQSHLMASSKNYAIIQNGRHVQLLTKPIKF